MNTQLIAVGIVLGFAAYPAASFADTRAGGEGTITDITLDAVVDEATDIWETLESEALTLTTTSQCIVVACSDVSNNSNTTTDNDYRFVISLDDTSPGLNTSSERSIELSDNAGVDDPNTWPVCSTRALISVPAGAHTIYWLGSRANAADVVTTVEDTSMTIGCFSGTDL
jgi:hypothetical protein